MTTNKNKIIFIACLCLAACSHDDGEKKIPLTVDSVRIAETKVRPETRYFITGNFNGDGDPDTIFQSYKSSVTNLEMSDEIEGEDFEKLQELVVKKKPVTKLYASIAEADTFEVTKEFQQGGAWHFFNLGDLNADKTEEFGYMINWLDYSNINTFHILTLKNNRFKELFTFQINEAINFDTEELFEGKFLVRSVDEKTIEYKFFSDTATIETGRHTFD